MDKREITFYDEEFSKEDESAEEVVQFVVFRLANEWYGVDIAKVKQVVKVGAIALLPSAPAHILGVVNFRGNILSVTDLKQIFDLPRQESTDDTRLVVVEHGIVETGILTDEVFDVLTLPKSGIDSVLHTIPEERGDYVEGTVMVDHKLIGIINVEKILNVT